MPPPVLLVSFVPLLWDPAPLMTCSFVIFTRLLPLSFTNAQASVCFWLKQKRKTTKKSWLLTLLSYHFLSVSAPPSSSFLQRHLCLGSYPTQLAVLITHSTLLVSLPLPTFCLWFSIFHSYRSSLIHLLVQALSPLIWVLSTILYLPYPFYKEAEGPKSLEKLCISYTQLVAEARPVTSEPIH